MSNLLLASLSLSSVSLQRVCSWSLGRAELLQGSLQGLQVFSHLAQSVLDLAGLVQNLHAAGKGVVTNGKGTLDGCRVLPVVVHVCIQINI